MNEYKDEKTQLFMKGYLTIIKKGYGPQVICINFLFLTFHHQKRSRGIVNRDLKDH